MTERIPYRDPLSLRTLLKEGHYRIGEVVGEGNFSLIYAATQGTLELPVAVKEFFPKGCWREKQRIFQGPPWHEESFAESLQAFLTEGKTLKSFDHPGIVRVLDVFEANETAYLVEELLEGSTLHSYVELGPLSVELVLEIAAQLSEALLQVHTAGIIHADIKPENIFATHRGKYVLLDFSTARSYYEPEAWRPSLATVSPGYSPLEQYTRDQKLTRAADVYALAATLYTLLTGQPPPDAPARSRGVPLTDLSHLPAEIRKALRDALHLHPLRRTSSIGIFLEQLGLPPHRAPVVSIDSFHPVVDSYAHPGGVYALALRADSNILCSAGRDGCFRLWSWPECQLLRPQKVVNSPVKAVALSRDGLHLVTGAHDGSVRLWATREVTDGPWLVRQGPPVVSLRFDPLDRFVAAGFADGTCRMLGACGDLDIRWQAHPGAVHAMDINRQGTLLATVGDDAQVRLWNLPDATAADNLVLPESANSVRFHSNGIHLLTAARDHAVRLWDLQTRTEVNKFIADRADIWDAQFTSDPNTIVTISADHHLYGFRLDTGQLTHGSLVSGGLTGAMVVDPGRRVLVLGGSDGQISSWCF